MAQWSQAAMDKRIADKNAAILTERTDLFKRFRAGGWEINVLHPAFDREWMREKDNWFLPGQGCHFRVKMPGAYQMRIKTVAQLRRLVTGVE